MTAGENSHFKFHSRCRGLKLNHLCFDVDLLMFCKEDKETIQVLLEGFQVFSSNTGLVFNPNKSFIYCCGMFDDQIQEVTQLSGFCNGSLPFRYLGVPVSPWMLKASDCDVVVDKIIVIIRIWSSRHLSFAGMSQLVNSVLMSISVYWSQIFLFSKSMIK